MARDLNKLMGGAFAERVEQALLEVAENILDPNYKADAPRKINICMTIKPDEERDMANMELDIKLTLAPKQQVKTRLLFNRDSKGNATCGELNSADPNQLELAVDDEGVTEVQDNIALLQRA